MTTEIKGIEEQTGKQVAMIFIDTLARHLQGDENSTKDMSEFVRELFVEKYGIDKENNFKKIPAPSKFFVDYTGIFSEKSGLCCVTGSTGIIITNVYGNDILNKFEAIESALKTKYGSNLKINKLKNGSIWDEGKDWTTALSKNERVLVAFWDEEEKSNLSDNIKFIKLEAIGLSQDSAFILVKYFFDNIDDCKEEQQKNNTQGL